jgi:two-component system response regulator RegA
MNKDTILIIDDDETFRKRLAKAFRGRSIDTFEASNSKEAIELTTDIIFSKAVLDLRIKDESGLELLPKLLELNPDLKVLVLTGYGTISTAVQSLKLGAYNYLTKPTDADTILNSFDHTNSQDLQVPTLDQVEWDYIHRVIDENNGNISKASKKLGIHRRSLQRKLAKTPDVVK